MHQEEVESRPMDALARTTTTTECFDRSAPTASPQERSVPLRPGVTLPDWSVVRDESARAALSGIFELIGMGREKRSELGGTEDRVWRAVIEQFGGFGRAPFVAEIVQATGLSIDTVVDALTNLHARDVLVLDGEARIAGAYPFTERATAHRVALRGRTLTAMCAIDALGIGAMFGADTEIASSCLSCGAAIHVTTRLKGRGIFAVAPGTALVWAGLHYADGCSATSLCTVLAFFCCEDHLAVWQSREGAGRRGHCLSAPAALQVGRAIFEPILRPAPGVRDPLPHHPRRAVACGSRPNCPGVGQTPKG